MQSNMVHKCVYYVLMNNNILFYSYCKKDNILPLCTGELCYHYLQVRTHLVYAPLI